ncbi:UDPGT domain-containing protein, partial [Cephalotus follicularis]
QLVEYARDLANSKQTFLWVIKHDLVIGELAILPLEFLNNTKERGQIASWSPQEKVLSHPSIGVFLTHTGWNPTMESLPSRVPVGLLFFFFFFAKLQTNCWFCCAKLGISMDISGDVKRD